MNRIAFFAALVGLFSIASGQEGSRRGSVLVEMANFRNDGGNAAVALYSSPDGFPEDSTKVFVSAIGKIIGGKSRVVFRGLPYGLYAISVLHDENGNGRMEKGLFGIPKEGYGFSNDASGFMGAPSFDAAKFTLDRDSVVVSIKLRY